MIEGMSEKRLRAYFIADLQEALRTSRKGPKQSQYLEHLIRSEKTPPMPSFAGLGAGSLSGNTLDQLSQVSRGLPGI